MKAYNQAMMGAGLLALGLVGTMTGGTLWSTYKVPEYLPAVEQFDNLERNVALSRNSLCHGGEFSENKENCLFLVQEYLDALEEYADALDDKELERSVMEYRDSYNYAPEIGALTGAGAMSTLLGGIFVVGAYRRREEK